MPRYQSEKNIKDGGRKNNKKEKTGFISNEIFRLYREKSLDRRKPDS